MSSTQNQDETSIEKNVNKVSDSSNNLTHKELVKLTKDAINKIIESDPLLGGLAQDPTVEEVKAQASVAQGQSITLFLYRGELPTLSIVVPTHNTTVLDLKKAVKRHTTLALKRDEVRNNVSWKHVWKKYYLAYNKVKLTDDKVNIKEYGIVNKSEIYYVKRLREKNKIIN